MPGGPIDPDIVLDVIQEPNCTWSSNHLVHGTTDKWLVVTTAPAWDVQTTAAILLSQATFNDLKVAEKTAGNYVKVNGVRRQLTTTLSGGSTWAVLADP